MAPEMFYPNTTFGYGADTWSLGVIIFILATGSFPFGGANEQAVVAEITQEENMRNQRFMTLPQFSALSSELKDLIAGLLRTD